MGYFWIVSLPCDDLTMPIRSKERKGVASSHSRPRFSIFSLIITSTLLISSLTTTRAGGGDFLKDKHSNHCTATHSTPAQNFKVRTLAAHTAQSTTTTATPACARVWFGFGFAVTSQVAVNKPQRNKADKSDQINCKAPAGRFDTIVVD